jgi:hypothetical protein
MQKALQCKCQGGQSRRGLAGRPRGGDITVLGLGGGNMRSIRGGRRSLSFVQAGQVRLLRLFARFPCSGSVDL